MLTMIGHRKSVRRKAMRLAKRHAVDVQKCVPLEKRRIGRTQTFRHDDTEAFVKGDQSTIECSVVERVENDTIPWIRSSASVDSPGNDVAGVQELWQTDPGESAGILVTRHDSRAEKRLHPPGPNCSCHFCRSIWQGEYVSHLHACVAHTPCVNSLSFTCDCLRVAVESFPELSISAADVGQASDTPSLFSWIETGEVACLHGHGRRRAAKQARQFDDVRIVLMQLAKRRTAVKPERKEQLSLGPWNSSCHRLGYPAGTRLDTQAARKPRAAPVPTWMYWAVLGPQKK